MAAVRLTGTTWSPSRPHATAGIMRGMELTLLIFGTVFVAFCVWLVVRIVNRRETWAKWTATSVTLAVVVLYLLSPPWVGSYLTLRDISKERRAHLAPLYEPLNWLLAKCPAAPGHQYIAYCSWVSEITGAQDHRRGQMNKN